MNRTTLMLPSELKTRAQRRAKEMGVSLGQLIRQALESQLAESAGDRRTADPLFSSTRVFDGATPTDLAGDHDRYLYDESR